MRTTSIGILLSTLALGPAALAQPASVVTFSGASDVGQTVSAFGVNPKSEGFVAALSTVSPTDPNTLLVATSNFRVTNVLHLYMDTIAVTISAPAGATLHSVSFQAAGTQSFGFRNAAPPTLLSTWVCGDTVAIPTYTRGTQTGNTFPYALQAVADVSGRTSVTCAASILLTNGGGTSWGTVDSAAFSATVE